MQPRRDAWGLAAWRGRLTEMAQPHTHNEIEINLVASGQLTYLFGGRQLQISQGTVAVFWGAVPHRETGWHPSTTLTWVTLPLEQVQSWDLPYAARLLRGEALHTRAAAYDELLLSLWADALPQADADERAIIWLEAQAWCRRFGQRLPDALLHHAAPADKAMAMARYMIAHSHEVLTLKRIANAVNLHPSYASAIFRRAYGLTPTAYLAQARIAHAQRLLLMSDMSVTEIAFETGFQSVSRFYQAFEHICGLPPGRYRARLRA